MSNQEPSELKGCKKCGEVKHVKLFRYDIYKGKKSYGNVCRECRADYKRNHYLANQDRYRQYFRDYYKENSTDIDERRKLLHASKDKARRAVRNAVQNGKMQKTDCHLCSAPNAEFHHTHGYDEGSWFMGIWLCRACHAVLHRNMDEANRIQQLTGDGDK